MGTDLAVDNGVRHTMARFLKMLLGNSDSGSIAYMALNMDTGRICRKNLARIRNQLLGCVDSKLTRSLDRLDH